MNKLKTSKTDIGIVAIFTTLSILLLNVPLLNNAEIMMVFKIVIFLLPGYSLLTMLFPGNNVNKAKFFLASIFCSILIGFLLALVLGVFLNFNNETFINVLLVVTNVFIAIAFIRRLKLSKEIEKYIVCENCGGYYKLKKKESLKDFESCNCGGNLKYAEGIFSPELIFSNMNNTTYTGTNKLNSPKFKLSLITLLIIASGIILNSLIGIQLTSIILALVVLILTAYLFKMNYNVLSEHRFIANFSKYRYLLIELVKRDIKIRYRRSVLGIFWSFLNPLLMMIVLTIIFQTFFAHNIANYPVYMLTGKIVFDFYGSGSTAAMRSIKGNAAIIKKVYVPKYMYSLSTVLSNFVTFALSLIVLFGVMIATNAIFSVYILFAILPIFLLFIFTTGVGLVLATVTVFFRDMEHLYSVFVTMLMYGSAIFYPIDIVPESYRFLFELNPVYAMMSLCRDSFLYGRMFDLNTLLYSAVVSVVMLVLGIVLFYKYQDKFILYI